MNRDDILRRIVDDLRCAYGMEVRSFSSVSGGWLNLKWRVSTGDGDFLVKQFDPNRYAMEKLDAVEAALFRQILAREAGVPCPEILLHEGRIIRRADGVSYMVMRFCPGEIESPGTVTAQQMESLGDALGRMHVAFSSLPPEGAKAYPLDDMQFIDSRLKNLEEREREDGPESFRSAVAAQREVIGWCTPDFLLKIPKGIAHEDFSADNMLFLPGGVSAILDFDRNQYSYLWHDIGRALLSLALDLDGGLDAGKVSAFVRGYAGHMPLAIGDIADVLRLSLFIEMAWWILPEFFENPAPKTRRFRDEMLWLMENFRQLDGMV